MKNKTKKRVKQISIILSVALVVGLIGYFTILESVLGYENYHESSLSYSGSARYLGYGYPEGYIVTGEPETSCGGRTNNDGVIIYHSCEKDIAQLNLQAYEICSDKTIDKLGVLKLTVTGSKNCLNMGGSRYNCFGYMNFYDDSNKKISSIDISMRKYSDGWRGTDIINSEVTLDLANSYKNIQGQKCFNIYVSGLNKPDGTQGNALNQIDFSYNLVSQKLYYNAVECENNSQCGNLEICSNFKCIDNPIVIENLPEGVIEEIVEPIQCRANIECQSLCGTKVPSCTNNTCYCGNEQVLIEIDDSNDIYLYAIPISILGLVAFIIYQRRKKPKRR